MKRFFFVALAAAALFVPSLAAASDGVRLVYRPELRAMVPMPQAAGAATAAAPLTAEQVVARHAAMARGHRLNTRADAAAVAHCDRAIAQAQAEVRDQH
jgi:hypothetical protein